MCGSNVDRFCRMWKGGQYCKCASMLMNRSCTWVKTDPDISQPHAGRQSIRWQAERRPLTPSGDWQGCPSQVPDSILHTVETRTGFPAGFHLLGGGS